MANPPPGTELDTETFVSWREFLGSSHARALALVSLAVWLPGERTGAWPFGVFPRVSR